MSKDDEVGYGRPPKKNQFQPGKSGNPDGRPKRPVALEAELRRALEETITFKKNGEKCEGSIGAALIDRLIAMALRGDIKALKLVLNLWPSYSDGETAPPEPEPDQGIDLSVLTEEEQRVLAEMTERWRRGELGPPKSPSKPN